MLSDKLLILEQKLVGRVDDAIGLAGVLKLICCRMFQRSWRSWRHGTIGRRGAFISNRLSSLCHHHFTWMQLVEQIMCCKMEVLLVKCFLFYVRMLLIEHFEEEGHHSKVLLVFCLEFFWCISTINCSKKLFSFWHWMTHIGSIQILIIKSYDSRAVVCKKEQKKILRLIYMTIFWPHWSTATIFCVSQAGQTIL